MSVATPFRSPARPQPGLRQHSAKWRRDDAEEVRLRGQELEETAARLDAAVNNMPHGLMMVDAELSLVLCNHQLRELLNFDPDIVRPGVSMRHLLGHSIAVGNHPGLSIDQLVADVERLTHPGTRICFRQNMPGGRVLAVSWEPIAAGGWVCTYEDITVREAATAHAVHLACHDSAMPRL
eukprot:gene12014-12105_t